MTNEVEYICQEPDCKKPFKVKQGSRQRYCPECIAKKVLKGKK